MKKYWIIMVGMLIQQAITAQISSIDYLASNPDSSSIVVDLLETDALFYHSSFAPNEVVFKENGEDRINFSRVLDKLQPQNEGLLDLKINTGGATIHYKNMRLVVGHNLRYLGGARYSEELATISTLGNAGYIGQSVDIGPSFIYSHFHELYLGTAIDFGKLRVGGKVRMIAGNEYLRTEESDLKLTTGDQSFALTLDADYTFFSSSTLQYQGIDDINTDFDPGVYNPFFGDNQGLGFDFGMRYFFNDKLNGYAHLEGLGSIQWDNRMDRYSKQGESIYRGVDLLDYLSDDVGVTVEDSIYNLLDFENEKDFIYTDRLPLRFQLGMVYHISDRGTIELAYGRQNYRIHTLSSWMIAYQKELGAGLTLSTRLTGIGRSPVNIGLGFGWSLGPIRLMGNVSNVLGIANILSTRYNQIGLAVQVRI